MIIRPFDIVDIMILNDRIPSEIQRENILPLVEQVNNYVVVVHKR